MKQFSKVKSSPVLIREMDKVIRSCIRFFVYYFPLALENQQGLQFANFQCNVLLTLFHKHASIKILITKNKQTKSIGMKQCKLIYTFLGKIKKPQFGRKYTLFWVYTSSLSQLVESTRRGTHSTVSEKKHTSKTWCIFSMFGGHKKKIWELSQYFIFPYYIILIFFLHMQAQNFF